MDRIYEFTTWKTGREWDLLNAKAIESARSYQGKKYIVSIGEWGTTSFLVFADTKEEAKEIALTKYVGNHAQTIKVRDVTNLKKYNN